MQSKTIHAVDRWSPLGLYLYRAAKIKNDAITRYETQGLVNVRLDSAFFMQYESPGVKLERPVLVISGEIHNISGTFNNRNRTLSFSEDERPQVHIYYEPTDDELVEFIHNGLYRRDNYSKVFSDIMEGRSMDFEHPINYYELYLESTDETLILPDTINLSTCTVDVRTADISFEDAFAIIEEIEAKEQALPDNELASVQLKADEEKRNAFFEKMEAQRQSQLESETEKESESFEDEFDFDDEIEITQDTQIQEESMFEDLFESEDEPLQVDTETENPADEPAIDSVPETDSLPNISEVPKEELGNIYAKNDEEELRSSDELDEVDDLEALF